MPFTLSHPAAAVPLAKYGLPLSALIVGSMMPDLPYFTRLPSDIRYGHTASGLVLYCIPAGLLTLWLFHRVLKLPLLSLFPLNHQERLISAAQPFSFGPPRRFALIVLALALGALTHIVWDSFTHEHAHMVRAIPTLQMQVLRIGSRPLYLYKVLQYVSTFVGAALLLSWYFQWFRRTAPHPVTLPVQLPEQARLALIAAMAVFALCAGTFYTYKYSWLNNTGSMQMLLANEIVSVMIVLGFELFLFSLFWHLGAAKTRGSA